MKARAREFLPACYVPIMISEQSAISPTALISKRVRSKRIARAHIPTLSFDGDCLPILMRLFELALNRFYADLLKACQKSENFFL